MTLPICNRNQGNRAKAASRAVQGQLDLEAGLVLNQARVLALGEKES